METVAHHSGEAAWVQPRDQALDSNLEVCRPEPAIAAATAVLILGTAVVDPARLRLLLVPASFLIAAFGAGSLVCRAEREERLHLNRTPVLTLAVRIGSGIACLSLIAVGSALCGLLGVAGVAGLALLTFGLWELRRVRFRLQPFHRLLPQAAGGLGIGTVWLVA